jgi:hypothetical protein
LQQTQAQVDEVVDIMRVNVDKVLERDQKLSELDDRADALQAGASQFEASAGKLKRKFWWKNMKMMLVMGAVITVVVIILGAWIYGKVGGGAAPVAPPPVPAQEALITVAPIAPSTPPQRPRNRPTKGRQGSAVATGPSPPPSAAVPQ